MHFLPSVALLFAAIDGAFSQTTLSDPDSVPKATRNQWCLSQKTQCPYLCTQLEGTDGSPDTESNTCDADTLAFSCVCANGQTPNASEYSQTMPYYICTENNNRCVEACNGANTCQANCRNENPCGAQDPERVNTSTISTMSATGTGGSSASATGSGTVFDGFGGDSAATTGASSGNGDGNSGAAALAVSLGQVYGLTAVVVGLFVGFAVII